VCLHFRVLSGSYTMRFGYIKRTRITFWDNFANDAIHMAGHVYSAH